MSRQPLSGCRVLVPRGGELGARLASRIEQLGGTAVVAPLIAFAAPEDGTALREATARLRAGHYDWLVVTSATTVDMLGPALGAVPAETRVAAVGPATAAALQDRGVTVHLMPADDHSALGILALWPDDSGEVLLPQSEIAAPTLADGLRDRGMHLDVVTAYRTLPAHAPAEVRERVASGTIDAVLLTSGSTARGFAAEFAAVPASVSIVCIGESTARAAREAGLAVAAIAERSEGESLIEALVGLTT